MTPLLAIRATSKWSSRTNRSDRWWSEDGTDLLSCLGQPITDQSNPGYDDFWSGEGEVTPDDLMPDGETACWYFATAEPTGSMDSGGEEFYSTEVTGTETWRILFFNDPGFGF